MLKTVVSLSSNPNHISLVFEFPSNCNLAMKTDFEDDAAQLIYSDLKNLSLDAIKLAKRVIMLAYSGFAVSPLQFIASIAAIYLLRLDRNWKANISLLIPYLFFSLPPWIFGIFREHFGKWIALIVVVLRLLFPKRFPDWLELPAALVLLIVVAPDFLANTCRSNAVGVVICFFIAFACYLQEEPIRTSGCFVDLEEISFAIAIMILLVYPIWMLVPYTVQAQAFLELVDRSEY